jgi:hypothetical protein
MRTASALWTGPLAEHPLIRRLSMLKLDPDDFVIFGSGPLLAHGIRSDVGDLDIVARGPAWERAARLGEPTIGVLNGAPMIHFWGGLIEVSQGWISADWDADQLIDDADIVEGLRFARLEYVLSYKQSLRRAKDMADIVAIQDRLNGWRRRRNSRRGKLSTRAVHPLSLKHR